MRDIDTATNGHDNEKPKKRNTTGGCASPRGYNPLHGHLYHSRLAIVVLLRAYNNKFNFEISIEDDSGGKFDDIVYRRYEQGKLKETIFIQAKQRMPLPSQDDLDPQAKKKKTSIMSNDMVEQRSSPYYLAGYFTPLLSLRELHLCAPDSHRFVIHTNSAIDPSLKQSMQRIDPIEALSLSQDVAFYKINSETPLEGLDTKLVYDSIELLAKKFVKLISLNDDTDAIEDDYIFEIFSDLIKQSLEVLEQDNGEKLSLRCRFSTQFLNGEDSNLVKFKSELEKKTKKEMFKKYTQHKEFTVPKKLLTICPSSNNEIRTKITQFYNSFVLVCNGWNDEDLLKEARNLLKDHFRDELEVDAVLDKLQTTMFEVIKQNSAVKMDAAFINQIFQDVKCQKLFVLHQAFASEYISKLQLRYPYIIVNPDRLKTCNIGPLNDFIASENLIGPLNGFISSDKYIHELCTYYETDLAAFIVTQMLDQIKCNYLFIDCAEVKNQPERSNEINFMLTHHKNADKTVKTVVCLEREKTDMTYPWKQLAKNHQWKIIVVKRILNNYTISPPERCINVGDLTKEARDRLRTGYGDLDLFGTHVSFDNILSDSDDIMLLQALLEEMKGLHNLNQENYDKISGWYIKREFVPYGNTDETTHGMYDSSKIIAELSNRYLSKTVTFNELINIVDNLDQDDLEYACSDNIDTSDPPGWADDQDHKKVNILINSAGFGKSAYFTWLAWRLQNMNKALYVIKLNAMEYSIDFERLDYHKISEYNETQVVRLLYHFVYLTLFVCNVNRQTIAETDTIRSIGDRCAMLLRVSDGNVVLDDNDHSKVKDITAMQLIGLRLFREKLNAKQFVILLDGFDEVAAFYKEAVLACFLQFANLKYVHTIYISSRPNDFEKDFRQTFCQNNCRMYRLKQLKRRDHLLNLNKILTKEIKDDYTSCEAIYRQVIVRILFGIVDKALEDVKTVPLLLDMAFSRILPSIKAHIDFQSKTICGAMFKHEKFNTLQLVESFVQRKLEIATIDKTGLTDAASKTASAKDLLKTVKEALEEGHALSSIYVMFASGCREHLLSPRDKKRAKSFMEEVMTAHINAGLIIAIRDGIPLFAHRLFAEYFAACWLHEHEDRVRKEEFFRSKSFWTYGLSRMRSFFDEMIIREKGGCDIHLAVLNEDVEQVQALLRSNPALAYSLDDDERTPLHLAARKMCNRSDTRTAILQRMKPEHVNLQDTLFGWTALDYAFVTDNENAIKELLQLNAALNIKSFMEQLCSNQLDVIIRRAHRYCELIKTFEWCNNKADVIYARTVRYLIKKREVNIHDSQEKLGSMTVLQYCVKRKMYNMFREFTTQTGDPKKVLKVFADDLIQLAFEVHAHEITDFLIDECNFPIPWIKCSRNLIYALKALIHVKFYRSFKRILNQFFIQRNIECLTEKNIVDELPRVDEVGELSLDNVEHPKACCVQDPLHVELPLEEYDKYGVINDATVFELLLTTSVHEGDFHLTSYIVQKKQMIITNSLIVGLMRRQPKERGELHRRSVPCIKYLLDKSIDLTSTDELGRNLLHMAAQNGCFYVVHCLIMAGFNPTEANRLNGWNTFHYIAGSVYERNDRSLKMMMYLKRLYPNVCLYINNNDDDSVYELAVKNNHFKMAKAIFEDHFKGLPSDDRLPELLGSFKRMITEEHIQVVQEFVKFLSHEQGDWKEVYEMVYNDIPLI